MAGAFALVATVGAAALAGALNVLAGVTLRGQVFAAQHVGQPPDDVGDGRERHRQGLVRGLQTQGQFRLILHDSEATDVIGANGQNRHAGRVAAHRAFTLKSGTVQPHQRPVLVRRKPVVAPVPQEWIDTLTDAMERFDVHAREQWRPVIEEDLPLVIGVWIDENRSNATGIMMDCQFDAVPIPVWQAMNSDQVLFGLADLVGRLRGDGDETLTPVCDGYLLVGFGLVVAEINRKQHLTSNTFYLHDRLGNFLTRRFMGGNQGQPVVEHGYVKPGPDVERVTAETDAHPAFTDMHAALSTLLHACLAPPEQCRETFGPNVYAEIIHAVDNLMELLNPAAHPGSLN